MSKTEADILLKAAELVQTQGLWKKGMTNHGHCAVTAISATSAGVFPYYILQACKDAVCEVTGVKWDSVPAWNDAPERTKEEVVTMLVTASNLLSRR